MEKDRMVSCSFSNIWAAKIRENRANEAGAFGIEGYHRIERRRLLCGAAIVMRVAPICRSRVI
jgi:hypothetical protein